MSRDDADAVEPERTLGALPKELRERDQFVVWRREVRDGKTTKVPYSASSGRKASSTDPATWVPFEEALAALGGRGRYDGVGFVFTASAPICGVDLDKCRDPESGELEEWAAEMVSALCSYSEASPSGTGVHVFVRGELPPEGRKKGNVEMYDSGRFFTLTGRRLPDSPATVEDRQAELLEVHRRVFEKRKLPSGSPVRRPEDAGDASPLADPRLVALASASRSGDLFSLLMAGDWEGAGRYPSQSEADQALCSMLAFWSGGDPVQMDRIFRDSGLYRPKWDEKHRSDGRTYGQATMDAALAGKADFYGGNGIALANPLPSGLGGVAAKLPARGSPPPVRHRTDKGNAQRLNAAHGEDVLYVGRWRKFLVFTGVRWEFDDLCLIERWAKESVPNMILDEAKQLSDDERDDHIKFSRRSEDTPKIKAMIEQLKSEPGIAVRHDVFDRDPMLLNTLSGTVELETGELREHRREDLITKLAPVEYDPLAEAPKWKAMLERILPDGEVRGFVQRGVGYSASGHSGKSAEQVIFIPFGTGANGKSTFLGTLVDALGDYAQDTAPDLLVKRKSDHPTELADLHGVRMLTSKETDEGVRLNEALVKPLTGGEKIRARRMKEDFWSFDPTHSVWFAVNHKPEIRGTEHAIWRRVRVVPFTEKIPEREQNAGLQAELVAERPGILRWVIEGCLAWRRRGLGEPEAVKLATRQYREEMDVLSAYLEERCVVADHASVPATPLYNDYRKWSEGTGEKVETQRRFGMRLTERGYTRRRITAGDRKGQYQWLGIGLLHPGDPSDGTSGLGSSPGRAPHSPKHSIGEPSRPGDGGSEATEGTNAAEDGTSKVLPSEPSDSKVHREEAAQECGETPTSIVSVNEMNQESGSEPRTPLREASTPDVGSLRSLGSPEGSATAETSVGEPPEAPPRDDRHADAESSSVAPREGDWLPGWEPGSKRGGEHGWLWGETPRQKARRMHAGLKEGGR